VFNQNQFIINFQSRLTTNISLSGFYSLGKANSNTDGSNTFPANPYDMSTEYGRASTDVRHRFGLFGNVRTYWGISLNPFIQILSGRPYNITLGRDINSDTRNNERPALATGVVDCNDRANFRCTPLGNFKLTLGPNDVMIPRNFAEGPGSVSVNMRVSKTWSFGSEGGGANAQNRQQGQGQGRTQGQQGQGQTQGQGQGGGQRGGMMGGGMMGGGPGGGGPGGGGGGMRGGGGFGGGGFGGGGNAGGRYSLTFSLNFQNLLNHNNMGIPTGNLGSSFFGQSTSTGGGFGGFGGGNQAYNRRIDAQIRFSF
jgi:hypothetical protein